MSLHPLHSLCFLFFSSHDPAPPHLYTLSLHDALPISALSRPRSSPAGRRESQRISHGVPRLRRASLVTLPRFCCTSGRRSEEHTSELQSHHDLVCRLLLEKKNKNINHLNVLRELPVER